MASSIQILLLAGGLFALLASGMPVAFAFAILNLIAAYFIFGSVEALSFVVQAAFSSVSNISLTAVPFFLLMGNIFVRSGLSKIVLDAVETILFGVRASGSYVAVGSGSLFGALMGASIASTAVLGSTLVPELRNRGYSKSLSLGPILGAGTLSNLIPPSLGAVLIGSLAGISIGDLLIAGLGPAALIILLFCAFILWQSFRQTYGRNLKEAVTLVERGRAVLHLAPLVIPVFCVTGVIYLGIATPTEASATGSAATLLVAIFYRRMSWKIFKTVLMDTIYVTSMILLIVASSKAYSQILAISGVSREITALMAAIAPSPTFAVVIVLIFVLVLGCVMDQVSVIFVAVPLFVSIVHQFGIDPVWFGVLFSMAVGLGGISPPFGLNLFVLKGVSPDEIRMRDIYWIALPYVVMEMAAIAMVLLLPVIATFLIR